MTTPDDLITWLRAQLDTAAARPHEVHDLTCELTMTAGFSGPCTCGWARRILAEVDAKRAMLQMITVLRTPVPTPAGYPAAARRLKIEVELAEEQAAEVFAKLLALPFADREGYREEWRP